MLRFALWPQVLVLLLLAPAAYAGTWQRPVDGVLLRAFALGRDPYAGGWHRGVDFAAARGSPVRSACGGLATFAGRVPRGGLTVSVRCGAVVATYQQLGSVAVRARREVAGGALLGTVGASRDPREPRPHVHLGARELATGRYLDPLSLLGGSSPGRPPAPAPRRPAGRAPLGPAPLSPRARAPRPAAEPLRERSPRPTPWSPPALVPRPAPGSPRTPSPRAAPAPPRPSPIGPAAAPPTVAPAVPWPVWVGLTSLGLGLPIGGLVRLRRRRNAARHVTQTA